MTTIVVDKLCMSWMNIKNKDKRCQRHKLHSSDFCQYHKRTAIYMPQLKQSTSQIVTSKIINIHKPIIDSVQLDTICPETLLGIYDSWKDIPEIYWLKLNNRWWDVRILSDMFANQLCACEMQQPKPSYLHDPFDRRNFTPNELESFGLKCKQLKLKLYIGLIEFLKGNYKSLYFVEYGTSTKLSQNIIDHLSVNLRYRLINFKNSQDCYTGLWVPKSEQLSFFETRYKQYDNISMQLMVADMYYGHVLIDNPHKFYTKLSLDQLPVENSQIPDKYTCLYS